jgi:PmbA protein
MSTVTKNETALAEVALRAIEQARPAGAVARAVAQNSVGAQTVVRDGDVETASRDGYQSLSVTVYRDGRTGSASSASIDADAIDRAVAEALNIASLMQPDDDAGLPDPQWLAREGETVALYAPDERGTTGLIDDAFAIEAAAKGDDWRVAGTGTSSSIGTWALATSDDFCRASSFSFHTRWCSILASDGDVAVQDNASSEDRRIEHLAAAEQIADLALQRTLSARGARAIGSRRCPVLFEPRVGTALFSELVGALGGEPQYSRRTFLPDPIGTAIVADHIDVAEDPFEPFGMASAPFDGEGVAGTRRKIIDAGIAKGLFLAARSARLLQMESTGNSNGPYNLRLTSKVSGGDADAMRARLGTGLVVTSILGGATEPVRGGWSYAVAGFWVENGEIAHAVKDITLAGNLTDMLRGIVAVGDDVERHGPFRNGSILIDEMQVGGAA